MSSADKASLKAKLDRGSAIVLATEGASSHTLNDVLETGLLPKLSSGSEAFGIKKMADGTLWTSTFYWPLGSYESHTTEIPHSSKEKGPSTSAVFTNETYKTDYADVIIRDVESWIQAEAPSLDEGDGDPQNNLTSLAQQYIDSAINYIYATGSQTVYNSYQINNFAYSCGKTDEQWFLLIQKCIFSSSNLYQTQNSNQYAWYATSFTCDSFVTGHEGDFANVKVIKSSPDTTTGVSSVTSSVSESLSGTVGFSQEGGASGSVTGGISISNSTTVNVPDVTVSNNIDQVNNAKWIYTMPFCTPDEDGCVNSINAPQAFAESFDFPAC